MGAPGIVHRNVETAWIVAHGEGHSDTEILGILLRFCLLRGVAPDADTTGHPELVPLVRVAQRGISKDAILIGGDLGVAILGQEHLLFWPTEPDNSKPFQVGLT